MKFYIFNVDVDKLSVGQGDQGVKGIRVEVGGFLILGMTLMYFTVPIIFGDFVNLTMEAVKGQIFKSMGAGVRGQSPILGKGTRKSVRLS